MIAGVVLIALAGVGLSMAASGIGLLIRRSPVPGGLLAAAGSGLLAASLAATRDHPDVTRVVIVGTAGLLVPLALTTYPGPAWRHPVDVVALATVTGSGVLTVVLWSDNDAVGSMGLVTASALLAHTWWRIERSGGDVRRALVWMSLGVAVPGLVSGVAVFAATGATGGVLTVVLFVLLGPAMYVGVTRPEVVDARGLVVHAVVFSLAGAGYVAAFITVESLLELAGSRPPSVGVMAVVGLFVAATLHPVQLMLRGVVDELLFGQRPDPLDAATDVVGHIGDDPVLALSAIRATMVLPYAALTVDGHEVARSGTAVTHTRTLPLELGEAGRGELVVGLRPGDLGLTAGDRDVLRLVAPLLAQTLRAGRLAADLQLSREATVTALEEERRRLRRDLHDGLGPRLSGIAFTSDAARNSLRGDPDATDALLAVVRAETVTAIEEIRRLVYAMRPPALDELGLVPALRQQATSLRTARGQPLQVLITADELPQPVAAAVEVAAYRIVMESLTNVARHSGCQAASVVLQTDTTGLIIDVTDRGAPNGEWHTGVGIASMRERAAQLGGTLVAASSGRGGHVHAVLPLNQA